jgi:hypothetical protein
MMPEASDMRGWYSPDMRTQVQQFLDRLCREHPISVIDARDWLSDEHFSDALHLIVAGADTFTQRLCRQELPALMGRTVASHPRSGQVR